VSGTLAVAAGTEAVAVVAEPQLPLAAEQRRPQVRRLVERVPHQPRAPRPRLAEPEPRQHRPQAVRRRQVELRRRVERQQLPAVEAEGVVVAISPATQTRMAPLTPDSARWLAIPTACRR